jgi:predicted RNase H-like nuclease
MNRGQPLAPPKTSWLGVAIRRRLLAEARIDLPDNFGGPANYVPVDDLLDAAAAAWSAARVARGEADSLPEPPEMLDGTAAAIRI